MKKFILLIAVVTLLYACSDSGSEDQQAEISSTSVTLWSAKTELFMEHRLLVVGEEGRFAVHLTWLKDFKPVTEGTLELNFVSSEGKRASTTVNGPTSPGIFRPSITLDQPGLYDLTMIIDGTSRDTVLVEEIRVYASRAELPYEEDASGGEQLITFLKEQQWKTDFSTQAVQRRNIAGTVRAACEILPRLHNEAIVSAPFTGTIPLEENPNLPMVGQKVNRGEVLAVMVPSAETPGGIENFASRFIEAKSDRELAEKEFARVKQLHAGGLVSEKEYQEAEAEFKQADATYQTLGKYAETSADGQSLNAFVLKAPLTGTIITAHVVPGAQIDAGETLYRIIDASSVWIRANVASTEIGKLNRPRRAWLQLSGEDKVLEVNERNGKLISVATAIDPETRTFPVIFEVRNSGGDLRIGLFGEVNITTGMEKTTLVVPQSALIEEEGRYSVYVQVEGEAFAKRDVTQGERNGEYVEILSGLSEGERVVTVGAYQVRLASLSSQLPAHGHEH